MPTTYSAIWRSAQLVSLDPAVRSVWGPIVDEWPVLAEQGAVGNTPIPLTGTAVSLTTANNAPDQARLAMWNFTGALTANCTVTIPPIARVGYATNNTTGSHNVILTTGSGTTLTLAPGLSYMWTCDGTNVAKLSQTATSLAAAFGWEQSSSGTIRQWGSTVTPAGGSMAVGFARTFPTAVWNIQASVIGSVGTGLAIFPVGTGSFNVDSFTTSTGVVGGPVAFHWQAIGN